MRFPNPPIVACAPADFSCSAARCALAAGSTDFALNIGTNRKEDQMFDVSKRIPTNDTDDKSAQPGGGTLLDRLAVTASISIGCHSNPSSRPIFRAHCASSLTID